MICKILVLASNPQDTAQLLLNREIREIEDALEKGKYREQFSLCWKDAVRVDDLQSSLQKESARIVHFCGHGMGSQGLVLETRLGEQRLLDTQAIADLFRLFKNQIECVVLNACYSQVQATEISKQKRYRFNFYPKDEIGRISRKVGINLNYLSIRNFLDIKSRGF